MQRQKITIGVRLIEAGDYLFASDLLEAWNNFLRLLSEVDLALSVQSTRTIDWSVSQWSRSSPAMLTLEPVVIDEQLDNRETVIRTAMSGMAALKERDERPKYFSDQALTNARGLVSLLGPRVRTVEVFTPEDRVICTEAIASNIREILRPGREMMGSTEGVLEAMNSHGKFQFSLYEPVLATRIGCELDKDAEPGLKARIIELYEQRVRVSGVLRTNRHGEVRSVRVRQVTALRKEPRFERVEEIAGIYDITGGLDAEEYVRRLRDA